MVRSDQIDPEKCEFYSSYYFYSFAQLLLPCPQRWSKVNWPKGTRCTACCSKYCIPFCRDADQAPGSGMAQRMKRSKKKKKSSSSSSEQRRRKGGSGKKKGFLSRVFGWFFSFHVCTFYTLHFYVKNEMPFRTVYLWFK